MPRIGARLHLISDIRDVQPAGRLATRVGLNHADRSRPGTWYLFADAEAFVPLNDQNPETFATKWRFRVGPGVTADRTWRFEFLYIHDITRNTMRDDFDASVNAIDLRAKHYF